MAPDDRSHDQSDESTRPIRVLVVDDHEVLAESLAYVLGAEPDMVIAGIAGSVARARALVVSTHPDVIVLDHQLPDGAGVSAVAELRGLRPSLQVVMLTASSTDHVLLAAIEAGVSGFVSKSRGVGEVIAAVRSAAAGDAVISPEMLVRLLPRLHRGRRVELNHLTGREHEVLGLLSEGLSNAAIADRLVVSVHTVRNHVSNLSTKLGAHSKLEALSIAVREGLLQAR